MRDTNERGCWARKPCALSTRAMRPQPTRAITLAVARKRFANRDLIGRLGNGLLAGAPLGIIRSRGHAQYLAELAHGHLAGTLGNVLAGIHRSDWPKMTKAFFKCLAPARPA